MTTFRSARQDVAEVVALLDLVVESQLKPYDIVPLIPILEGAGCIVTDWRGQPALNGGDVVAAGSRELHTAALAVLRL